MTENNNAVNEVKTLEERVIDVIKSCYDPEIPVNIYDLGLIYEVKVNEGNDISIKILIKAGMNYEKIINDEDTKDSSYEGELFYSINLNEYLDINSMV